MSEAAIPHVLNIATQRGAETDMVLLSAIDPGVITVSREQLREREREYDRVKAYLDEVAQRIETAGFAARTEVLMGEPAEAIIGYLKANPPQLICMATRGKTGLSKFVFGSVTEHVIRLIKKTPMLLVSGAEQD
jgi:nucleotide-binding universal stress UspA family protein